MDPAANAKGLGNTGTTKVELETTLWALGVVISDATLLTIG
jgi:hypothetical protein